jgi:hypothetical protein
MVVVAFMVIPFRHVPQVVRRWWTAGAPDGDPRGGGRGRSDSSAQALPRGPDLPRTDSHRGIHPLIGTNGLSDPQSAVDSGVELLAEAHHLVVDAHHVTQARMVSIPEREMCRQWTIISC